MNATSFIFFISLFFHLDSYSQDVIPYEYTGDVQLYVVPVGIYLIQIEAYGAQGQSLTIEDFTGSIGGLGGFAVGELAVIPGDTLRIYVGASGVEGMESYNGGAIGGYGTPSDGDEGYAGSGGGASDIRQGGTELENRVIVAGGGGGGGRDYVNGSCIPCGTGGNGGIGGGIVGGDGDDPDTDIGVFLNPGAGGKGGTSTIGGIGGHGIEGEDGNDGVLGIGGIGINGTYSVASGGGGGGYFGGGSGAGANSGSGKAGGGGAGGSSYIDGVTDGETIAGSREGDGLIIITEVCEAMTVEISDLEICEGEELTLSAFSSVEATVIWSGGDVDIVDGIPFVPSEIGEITFTALSDSINDCPFYVTIIVHEAPEIIVSALDSVICEGEALMMIAEGADSIAWNYGALDSVLYIPSIGTGVFTFTAIGIESEFGCKDSASIEITIHEIPTVVGTSDKEIYCDGDIITLTGTGAEVYEWDLSVVDGEGFIQEIDTIIYTVIGTSIEGCVDTNEIEVIVVENPTITITSTDEIYGMDGTTTLIIDSGTSPYLFDWDNDGTGDVDDEQNLTGLIAGTYSVVVMDANGCKVSDTIIVHSQLSIVETIYTDLKVFPNPTNGQLNIVKEGEFDYLLTSLTGQIIINSTAYDFEEFDLSHLSDGIYLLTISNNSKKQTIKVVKKGG